MQNPDDMIDATFVNMTEEDLEELQDPHNSPWKNFLITRGKAYKRNVVKNKALRHFAIDVGATKQTYNSQDTSNDQCSWACIGCGQNIGISSSIQFTPGRPYCLNLECSYHGLLFESVKNHVDKRVASFSNAVGVEVDWDSTHREAKLAVIRRREADLPFSVFIVRVYFQCTSPNHTPWMGKFAVCGEFNIETEIPLNSRCIGCTAVHIEQVANDRSLPGIYKARTDTLTVFAQMDGGRPRSVEPSCLAIDFQCLTNANHPIFSVGFEQIRRDLANNHLPNPRGCPTCYTQNFFQHWPNRVRERGIVDVYFYFATLTISNPQHPETTGFFVKGGVTGQQPYTLRLINTSDPYSGWSLNWVYNFVLKFTDPDECFLAESDCLVALARSGIGLRNDPFSTNFFKRVAGNPNIKESKKGGRSEMWGFDDGHKFDYLPLFRPIATALNAKYVQTGLAQIELGAEILNGAAAVPGLQAPNEGDEPEDDESTI